MAASTARALFLRIMGGTDVVRPDLFSTCAEGGNDVEWVRARLVEAGLGQRVSVTGVDVCAGGELPPSVGFDVAIVGGSYHNVNEGHAWQHRTMEWLREWRRGGRPMLGICGGHQMAAVLLGGSVSPMGGEHPWVGTMPVRVTDEGRDHYLFAGLDGDPHVHLGHYDHVERTPSGARLLAEREGVVQALDFGGGWIGVQFHPEASAEVMERSWGDSHVDAVGRYRSSAAGARIVANFLRGSGVVAND